MKTVNQVIEMLNKISPEKRDLPLCFRVNGRLKDIDYVTITNEGDKLVVDEEWF